MALFCVPGSARPVSRLHVCVCTRGRSVELVERRNVVELVKGRTERWLKKERDEEGSKSRQWLKSLLPLSISTRTSTRRNLSSYPEEYHPSTFLPPSISSPLSAAFHLYLSRYLDSPRSLPCWQSKFISRSCLFWTFHNIWPCFGIQHRSRRAPVTRRYGFEPSVMDGSLSSPPRIAASTLILSLFCLQIHHPSSSI